MDEFMKFLFTISIYLFFSSLNIVNSSARIGGWDVFYFGMSQSEIDTLLSMKCETSQRNNMVEAFSEGKQCGKFLGENYDLSIHTLEEWWIFSRKAVIISIKMKNTDKIHEKLINFYDNKWQKKGDSTCSKVLDTCYTYFSELSEIIVMRPNNKDKKISIEFMDRNRFNN